MSEGAPQNPVFRVDDGAVEAVWPKMLCQECGTVMGLRSRRFISSVSCPACGARHRLTRHHHEVKIVLEESPVTAEKDSSRKKS